MVTLLHFRLQLWGDLLVVIREEVQEGWDLPLVVELLKVILELGLVEELLQ